MIGRGIWLLLACAFGAASASAHGGAAGRAARVAPAGDRAEYRVTFSERRRRLVHVEAEFVMRGDRIGMSPVGAIQIAEGWARFVEDLRATDERGRELRVRSQGRATWRVGGRRAGRGPRRVRLSYDVRLDHDREEWPFGLDEASYLRDDCIYCATSTLFIAPYGLASSTVRFDLPEGWIASAGWPRAPRDPDQRDEQEVYAAGDFEQLTRSCLLVGRHVERNFHAGGARWVVAAGAELEPSLGAVEELLESAVHQAGVIFGGVPERRYLLILNLGQASGGSGHVGGMSMVLERPPTEGDVTWAHILVHELLHMWNGVAIRRKSHREEWFTEGVTDYLTLLLLARTGVLSPDAAARRLARSYDMYRREAGALSLVAAGRAKPEHFDLLYGGGLLMGLLLDVEIRYGSGGQRSIEDLLHVLYDEFGDGAEGCSVEDVAGVASDLADFDLEKLFRRYVSGERVIPVASYLRRMGLALDTGRRGRDARVLEHAESTPRQERLRAQIFGQASAARDPRSFLQDQRGRRR